MIKLENKLKFYFDDANAPKAMTEEDDKSFGNATECSLCNQPLTPSSLQIDMHACKSLRKGMRSLSSNW